MNPSKVSKNQIKFKSDLIEIKKGNPKSKTENQISVIQNVQNFLILREKNINFFLENILFCYLRLNTKQNAEGDQKVNS